MLKRLEEERRWFYQSAAILTAFCVSILPIFIFYVSSCLLLYKVPILIQLLVWWLFISGASFNFFIYNLINPNFRKKFLSTLQTFCLCGRNKRRTFENRDSISTKITFLSSLTRAKSRESQISNRSKKTKSCLEEEQVETIPLNYI